MLDNLADMLLSLCLVGGCPDAVERVGELDENGVADYDLGIRPSSGEPIVNKSVYTLYMRNRVTHVLDIASNNSCASGLTPLPFCASFFFISRIVWSSRACSAAISTLEILGRAPSKPAVDSGALSPDPRISKDSMCAKGMIW